MYIHIYLSNISWSFLSVVISTLCIGIIVCWNQKSIWFAVTFFHFVSLLFFCSVELEVKNMGCLPTNGLSLMPFSTCDSKYQICPGTDCVALVRANMTNCNFRCTCKPPCHHLVIPVMTGRFNDQELCEVHIKRVVWVAGMTSQDATTI